MATTTDLRSVALLERAVGYTGAALDDVRAPDLDAPTPCAGWTLRRLLEHMDDALAAFTEAAAIGDIDLHAVPPAPGVDHLVARFRVRACALLVAWQERTADAPVAVGAGRIDQDLLAGIGALEITVHGWDVAVACGRPRPLPADLAPGLLEVARGVVGPADRGRRFGPALGCAGTDPGQRLLAFLGRRETSGAGGDLVRRGGDGHNR